MTWKEIGLAGIIAIAPSTGYMRSARADDVQEANNSGSEKEGIDEKLKETFRLADLAVSLSKQGKHKEALELYQRADRMVPNDDDLIGGMAFAYDNLGNFTKAEELYKKALELDRDDFETNHNYGIFLCKRERFQESIPFLEVAVQKKPKSKVTVAWLGYAQKKQ
tara:strand:+ start:3868 stop:4362 length:495 start_codon:yes stop_codon:yes gene_type:complete